MATQVNFSICKPDKFSQQCSISSWLGQFELYIDICSVTDDKFKLKRLLSFLEVNIYDSVVCTLDIKKTTYQNVRDFLINRYCEKDDYMERIHFFTCEIRSSPEEFANVITCYIQNFDKDSDVMIEQLSIAKYISTSTGRVGKELRLRRPQRLNECVKIANAVLETKLETDAMTIKKIPNSTIRERDKGSYCYRCGSQNHLANTLQCPALQLLSMWKGRSFWKNVHQNI